MKIDKSIRAMPWPEPYRGGNQDFAVTLDWPTVGGERLLVATFTVNVAKQRFFRVGPDIRLVCSKKQRDVAVIVKGTAASRAVSLERAMKDFQTSPSYCYPEISERDEKALEKWLGKKWLGKRTTRNHFMQELNEWTEEALQAAALARADARGELRDEDVDLCPEELPEGLIDYIRRVPLREDHVLLYKKGNVRGTCFQCRQKVKAIHPQRFRQHESAVCPNCGAGVLAILEGGASFKADYVDDIVAIQRGTDGETVFLRQWHIVRDDTAQWENIPAQLDEIARYAIRGNHVAKWQREEKEAWCMNYYRYRLANWERRKNVTDIYDGRYYFFLPDNWKDILAGTSLQYCDLDGYIAQRDEERNTNPVRFLIDWPRYPAIEKFWKAGYTDLVHDRIRGFRTGTEKRDAIRWKQDSIRAALRFPVRLLKMYRPEEWTAEAVAKTVAVWDLVRTGPVRESEVEAIVKCAADLKDIKDALGHASIRKITGYLDKLAAAERERHRRQKEAAEKEGRTYYPREIETPRTYRDYLADCVRLGLDLDDPAVLFPANLDAAHARTIAQVKHKANEKSRAAFQAHAEKLAKLAWAHDGLLIRPPADADELTAEGAYLHHCVGGYVGQMARGETAILFIRREEDPDTPFFTLEWRNGRVIQCRTTHNRSYESDDQVQAFVEAWVKRATKKQKATKAA